jgi:hypothetical protein
VIWRAPRVTIDVGVAPAIRLAGGATLSYMNLASVLLTAAFFIGLFLFFRFTRLGAAMRSRPVRDRMHFRQWKRREFISLLGGAAVAWPLAARAQLPVIGYLSIGSQKEDDYLVTPFLQGLQEAGFVAGGNQSNIAGQSIKSTGCRGWPL